MLAHPVAAFETRTEAGSPSSYFHEQSGASAPWEIDQAQPAVIQLAEKGVFHGHVLDVGCCIGDNSLYIANHSDSTVLGVDLVPRAIEAARQKAARAKITSSKLEFAIANVLEPIEESNALYKRKFDVILDSAIFHIFSDADRQIYSEQIKNLLKPKGVYIQLVISDTEARPGGPRRVGKKDIVSAFRKEDGWNIISIEETSYLTQENTWCAGSAAALLTLIQLLP